MRSLLSVGFNSSPSCLTEIILQQLRLVVLFVIGVGGVVLNRTNIIMVVLMSLELALLSVSLNFIIFSVCLGDLIGQIFAIFILIIAACESSIGLAIIAVSCTRTVSVPHERCQGQLRLTGLTML